MNVVRKMIGIDINPKRFHLQTVYKRLQTFHVLRGEHRKRLKTFRNV